MKKVEAIKSLMSIPLMRLPSPRILFTLDSKEPKYESEIEPVLSEFVKMGIPLTVFVTNMTLSGQENYPAVKKIMRFSQKHSFPIEIASHGVRHDDLSRAGPSVTAETINQSLRSFNEYGIYVRGFRAPFFSTENSYRDVLSAVTGGQGGLKYDSSTCFGSNVLTSLFNIMVRRKCPHRIGDVYELPVSALDDYHILLRMKRGHRFAYHYWKTEVTLWIRRLNYYMILFHPHIIANNLGLLNKFLLFCRDRFPSDSFMTCSQLVNELDTGDKTPGHS